jgi:sugar phosphate isomerase/epimerase
MYGYISAQQAAKRNGLFNQQDFARAVYNHASVVRSEYGLIHSEPFTPSGAYGSAWEEVADMLELAADHGVAVEAAWQYYASYANMNHLLLNPGFYDAVAGRSWCWFYFNAFNEWLC